MDSIVNRTSNIDFFKELYHKELERSYYYDKIVQYPTTIIFLLIGGVFYSYSNFFKDGIPEALTNLDYVFSTLIILFTISILITIFLLFKVFHGFTRKYGYLPYTRQLKEREDELFQYVNENKEAFQLNTDEKIISKTQLLIKQDILKYYIDLTNINQLINDNRANNFAKSRNFIFINLILFIIIGIIGILPKNILS
jgi:hypothetical protein